MDTNSRAHKIAMIALLIPEHPTSADILGLLSLAYTEGYIDAVREEGPHTLVGPPTLRVVS